MVEPPALSAVFEEAMSFDWLAGKSEWDEKKSWVVDQHRN
jgi:hypothetical protein